MNIEAGRRDAQKNTSLDNSVKVYFKLEIDNFTMLKVLLKRMR